MFAEVNGTRIYYELSGEGSSRVVMLHGWGCSSKLMQVPAAVLAGEHRVLNIDFPGHGQSDRPPEPWGIPEYAKCLKALLEQLDFVPCAAVAHSFGCRVATWAASEWPELFTRLVFTGAAGLRAPQTEEGRKRAESYQQKKRFLHRLEQLPFLHSVGESLEERLRQKYGSADYNALDAEMRQTFVKVIQLDLRDRYPLIQQSTLLLWGDEDRETPLWMGREMEKLIPDAGLVLLEGGSHFAYLEQAQRFGTIVQHFLADG